MAQRPGIFGGTINRFPFLSMLRNRTMNRGQQAGLPALPAARHAGPAPRQAARHQAIDQVVGPLQGGSLQGLPSAPQAMPDGEQEQPNRDMNAGMTDWSRYGGTSSQDSFGIQPPAGGFGGGVLGDAISAGGGVIGDPRSAGPGEGVIGTPISQGPGEGVIGDPISAGPPPGGMPLPNPGAGVGPADTSALMGRQTRDRRTRTF